MSVSKKSLGNNDQHKLTGLYRSFNVLMWVINIKMVGRGAIA